MSEVMSFGDNFNDIEILKASGLGVAVGNAKEEVKLIADKTIENAKEDGVANFLNAYFKKG
jgi:hydroxymethylpyrimidine pyrophosphatase-like HAD family hydrolase